MLGLVNTINSHTSLILTLSLTFDVVLTLLGLTNPEEFSFTTEEETSDQTVRRHQQYVRDQKKLDTLKKKLHTDDEC